MGTVEMVSDEAVLSALSVARSELTHILSWAKAIGIEMIRHVTMIRIILRRFMG